MLWKEAGFSKSFEVEGENIVVGAKEYDTCEGRLETCAR